MRPGVWMVGLALLAACGRQAQYQPNDDELMHALRAGSDTPIIDASVGSCERGTLSGTEIAVQVCQVCFAVVRVGSGEDVFSEAQFLTATRASGTATFRRAISFDQSNVEPPQGERGVFVTSFASSDRARLMRGAPTVRFSNEQMARVGFRRRIGFSAVMATSTIPRSVRDRITNDEGLQSELLSALPDCPNLGRSAAIPVAPAPQAASAPTPDHTSPRARSDRIVGRWGVPGDEWYFRADGAVTPATGVVPPGGDHYWVPDRGDMLSSLNVVGVITMRSSWPDTSRQTT